MRRKFSCFLIVILTLLVGMYQFAKSRKFQLLGTIVNRVETNVRIVALTFDDGPAANTDTLLQILQRYNVRATFFLTGQEINANPAMAGRILMAGHALGNHSFSHRAMVFKSQTFIKAEIERTDSAIRALGYTGTIYFRPPYGKKLFGLPYYLSKTDRVTVTWNVEPDSKDADPVAILANVKEHVVPGSIILLHGMYSARMATVAALPGIIEWLQQQGYTFVTVDELLRKTGVGPTARK